MKEIVLRSASLLNIKMDNSAALEIAQISRGTPRVASRLVRRLRDIITSMNKEHSEVNKDIADQALSQLGVDSNGLDQMDQNYL